ncbi:MAG: vWA domain-containing protein [Myxococcota bacterium]
MVCRPWFVAFAAVAPLLACGRTPPAFPLQDDAGGTQDSGDTTDTGESTGELNCVDSPEACIAELSLRRAVDILFVIDNSGSMGGDQGTLARSFGTFVDVLEAQQVGANYRIGVATTEGDGFIHASSCRSRLDDFVSSSTIYGDKDERQRGCLDHCQHESIGLANPWVEKSNGTTNLPPGVTMAEALQCIGPQGITGSGFEMPLESMRRLVSEDPQGFLRTDALLAVIFVTDEADCSMSDDNLVWLSAFGEPFWTSPERLSSGACWSAGVQCEGGPGVFDSCETADKDRNAEPTSDPSDAVLYPIDRYVDALTELAAEKQAQGGQSEVLIAVLAGVPLDYPETGEIVYADSPDIQFNEEYGIGPGCGHGTEQIDDPPGIPPVRLREFAEAFASERRNMFSICADEYGIALQDIADAIGEINSRACVAGCVHDLRYDIPQLQPDCQLVETYADGAPDQSVSACVTTEAGWDFPNPATHVCYRALVDADASTETAIDDMSPQCVTLGSNLELVVQRREGIPVPSGTAVKVRCDLDAPFGVSCEDR